MKRPAARPGKSLKVKSRPLPFSYWPMYRTTGRYGLQSLVFVTNPWASIRSSIRRRLVTMAPPIISVTPSPNSVHAAIPTLGAASPVFPVTSGSALGPLTPVPAPIAPTPAASQPAALAFVEQAEDFYTAATTAGIVAAKPLLLYYSFLNLAKAYILTVGQRSVLDKAQHGLSEQLLPGGRELYDAHLDAHPTSATNVNIFDEFTIALGSRGLSAKTQYHLKPMLPQILLGHRLWADAAKEQERFISVAALKFFHDTASKTLWLNLYIYEDDVKRLDLDQKDLLDRTGLGALLHVVRPNIKSERKLIQLELITPLSYSGRPSDEVPRLVDVIRPYLWRSITSVPPYRKYYLYLQDPTAAGSPLPQLLSIYALFYYLGSVTRYRPHVFDSIIVGEFGAQIEEFVSNQPRQFLYMMASEFAQQEVTKASVV